MALKKKDDGFEKIKLEAEESGINMSRAADGTYSATIIGGASLDEYPDARELLDDMLAIQEMDEKDDLFAYDNGAMGGYQVAVTGNPKPFEHASLAGAFAMAKASLIPAVKTAEKRIGTARVTSGPELSPSPTMAEIDEKETASSAQETKNPEAEILAPTKPNGQEKAKMQADDLRETIAQGILDLASQLTTMATSLRSSPGTIPFVQKGFAEGEPEAETEAPAPARSASAANAGGSNGSTEADGEREAEKLLDQAGAALDIGRRLQLMSRVSGEPQQEILRKLVEAGLDEAYDRMIDRGAKLPPAMAVASMSEAQFEALIGPEPRKGPRLRKPEHVGA